jgi:hypothetical protein
MPDHQDSVSEEAADGGGCLEVAQIVQKLRENDDDNSRR